MLRSVQVATLAALLYVINTAVAMAVPNPGRGTAPPGSGAILKVAGWFAWLAVLGCVIGIIKIGAMLVVQHQTGHGGGGAGALVVALFGCILVGSASAIVGSALA